MPIPTTGTPIPTTGTPIPTTTTVATAIVTTVATFAMGVAVSVVINTRGQDAHVRVEGGFGQRIRWLLAVHERRQWGGTCRHRRHGSFDSRQQSALPLVGGCQVRRRNRHRNCPRVRHRPCRHHRRICTPPPPSACVRFAHRFSPVCCCGGGGRRRRRRRCHFGARGGAIERHPQRGGEKSQLPISRRHHHQPRVGGPTQ
ncbi:hypothetical protein I4F81_011381 [Pyropia yezoensis]|uniref:Uncharacterized protein n=1 Tax=Pyropia yezoensis TaxID=2788 RepID=A0ACC3CG42_PYRYE|nr:hypothetical protein I4F81_011381 [Neopyropia yezoensis]